MPDAPDPIQDTLAVITPVVQIIAPYLGPYGSAITAALVIAAKVEPVLYQSIASVVTAIKAGREPDPTDLAALDGYVNALKHPDRYFPPDPPTLTIGS